MATLETSIDGDLVVRRYGASVAPIRIRLLRHAWIDANDVTIGLSKLDASALALDLLDALELPEELYATVELWVREQS